MAAAAGDPARREDILWQSIGYGFSVGEYLCYGFADKSPAERRAFLSERESVLLSYQLNDLDAMRLFADKARTYERFGRYYGRELLAVGAEDFDAFARFTAAHPRFVVKPRYGSCGRGVAFVKLPADGKTEAAFRRLTADGPVVLEEPIFQSEAMARLNPSSVNTVRVITFFSKGNAAVICAFLKIGRAGSFIDNGAAGGVMAGIDPATGVTDTCGVDENGVRYETHPDSGVALKGFSLPDWRGLRDLCASLAAQIPEVRMIGWDAAHTPEGWVIVEGNAQSELIGVQGTRRRGLREELTRLLRDAGIRPGR